MLHNSVHVLSIGRTAEFYPEDKNKLYKNKLKKAGQPAPRAVLCPVPPPPDEKTIERLNTLARQAPFCSYHKYRKNNLL